MLLSLSLQVCEYDEVLATPIAGILDTELENVGKGVTALDPANNRSAVFVPQEVGVVVAGRDWRRFDFSSAYIPCCPLMGYLAPSSQWFSCDCFRFSMCRQERLWAVQLPNPGVFARVVSCTVFFLVISRSSLHRDMSFTAYAVMRLVSYAPVSWQPVDTEEGSKQWVHRLPQLRDRLSKLCFRTVMAQAACRQRSRSASTVDDFTGAVISRVNEMKVRASAKLPHHYCARGAS